MKIKLATGVPIATPQTSVAERDGFEPAVPLVQHETANFCDFAFSAREAEGISEAGGAGEGLAAGRV